MTVLETRKQKAERNAMILTGASRDQEREVKRRHRNPLRSNCSTTGGLGQCQVPELAHGLPAIFQTWHNERKVKRHLFKTFVSWVL